MSSTLQCRVKPYPEQGHDAPEVEQAEHAGDDDRGERVEGHVLEDRGEEGFKGFRL